MKKFIWVAAISCVILAAAYIVSVTNGMDFYSMSKWTGAVIIFIGILGLAGGEPMQAVYMGNPNLNTELATKLQEDRKPLHTYFRKNRILTFDSWGTVVIITGAVVAIAAFLIELIVKYIL